eukprot:4524177-Alexandrium_andersonii.AAC.1
MGPARRRGEILNGVAVHRRPQTNVLGMLPRYRLTVVTASKFPSAPAWPNTNDTTGVSHIHGAAH